MVGRGLFMLLLVLVLRMWLRREVFIELLMMMIGSWVGLCVRWRVEMSLLVLFLGKKKLVMMRLKWCFCVRVRLVCGDGVIVSL